MTSSEKPYKLAIPKRVQSEIGALIPYGLTANLISKLEELKEDPRIGTEGPDEGSLYHPITIFRPPIVFRLVVKYSVLSEHRIILVSQISVAEDDEE